MCRSRPRLRLARSSRCPFSSRKASRSRLTRAPALISGALSSNEKRRVKSGGPPNALVARKRLAIGRAAAWSSPRGAGVMSAHVPKRWVKLVVGIFLLPPAWVLTNLLHRVRPRDRAGRFLETLEESGLLPLVSCCGLWRSLACRALSGSTSSDMNLPTHLGDASGGPGPSASGVGSQGGHVGGVRTNTWMASRHIFPDLQRCRDRDLRRCRDVSGCDSLSIAALRSDRLRLATHLSFTCWLIPKGQPDLHYGGTFFLSWSYTCSTCAHRHAAHHRFSASNVGGIRARADAECRELTGAGSRSSSISSSGERPRSEARRFLRELQTSLGGCIPFDRWMHEALYHTDFGYYTANIREFGRRGDFTTWPAFNEGLGQAIAQWALRNRAPGRWSLLEIGGGTGELAQLVIRAIGWWSRPRYHIVEVSPRLIRAQRKRLGSAAIWHRSVSEALAATDGTALIVSNELVDAFPCRVFRKEPAGWRELALRLDGGRIAEEWLIRPLPGIDQLFVLLANWPACGSAGELSNVAQRLASWMAHRKHAHD